MSAEPNSPQSQQSQTPRLRKKVEYGAQKHVLKAAHDLVAKGAKRFTLDDLRKAVKGRVSFKSTNWAANSAVNAGRFERVDFKTYVLVPGADLDVAVGQRRPPGAPTGVHKKSHHKQHLPQPIADHTAPVGNGAQVRDAIMYLEQAESEITRELANGGGKRGRKLGRVSLMAMLALDALTRRHTE